MQAIYDFLLCETPDAWVAQALKEPEILLIDHANCEKKAASTAMNLMYRYIDNFDLLHKMSRLAREELRHFEQVIEIMENRGIVYDAAAATRLARLQQQLLAAARKAHDLCLALLHVIDHTRSRLRSNPRFGWP